MDMFFVSTETTAGDWVKDNFARCCGFLENELGKDARHSPKMVGISKASDACIAAISTDSVVKRLQQQLVG